MKEFSVKIKPLTPIIWTGDANRKCETLRETGIIGSLRWWYEALIRGLGGYACDPTDSKCDGKNHCDACELFGCNGWARKFRLEIEEQKEIITLKFIELREMTDVEWALLNKTLQIIDSYGALGGKIAEPQYGLIKIEQNKNDLEKYLFGKYNGELEKYFKKNGSNVENPNIKRFVSVSQKLNDGIVKDLKNNMPFLKGKLGKGKRYFYKTYNGKPYRLFMYAENDDEYEKIVGFLEKKSFSFKKGEVMLNDP